MEGEVQGRMRWYATACATKGGADEESRMRGRVACRQEGEGLEFIFILMEMGSGDGFSLV